MKKHLYLTVGDYDGIGPEVTRKALKQVIQNKDFSFISKLELVGHKLALARALREIDLNKSIFQITCTQAPSSSTQDDCGYATGWSIEYSAKKILSQNHASSALVTGPIDKECLNAGGYKFRGHTDFLASLCGDLPVTMLLAGPKLRVALITDHVPLHLVSQKLNAQSFLQKVQQVARFLNHTLKRDPKIAVLGLNPHCGENGLLGTEEIEKIIPWINDVRASSGFSGTIDGPYASDSFFVEKYKKFDAVICWYHDQGLTPLKMLNFEEAINITLGLPFLRTSVDHGTAKDIAHLDLNGEGIASSKSMVLAIQEHCK